MAHVVRPIITISRNLAQQQRAIVPYRVYTDVMKPARINECQGVEKRIADGTCSIG